MILLQTATPAEGAGSVFRWLSGRYADLTANVPEQVLNAFWAVVILVVGYYLAKFAVRLVGRPVARRFERPSITRTVLRLLRIGVFMIAVALAANQIGFRGTDILLSVTVFSAVLGLVLAPIIGSVINGLFVLADQPYEIGDMIELADTGQRGFVEDMTIRYTKMFTLDNTFIVISNSSVRDRDVINYSAEDQRTRLSLSLLVTYESDIQQARTLMERTARNVDNVIAGGPGIRVGSARYSAAPECYIDEFADHGVLLTLRYWVTQPYKLLQTRSKVQTELWTALQAEDVDVDIAYPHSHLYFDETSGEVNVAISDRFREDTAPGAVAPGEDPPGDGDRPDDRS